MRAEKGKANHWGPQVKDRIKGPRDRQGMEGEGGAQALFSYRTRPKSARVM